MFFAVEFVELFVGEVFVCFFEFVSVVVVSFAGFGGHGFEVGFGEWEFVIAERVGEFVALLVENFACFGGFVLGFFGDGDAEFVVGVFGDVFDVGVRDDVSVVFVGDDEDFVYVGVLLF